MLYRLGRKVKSITPREQFSLSFCILFYVHFHSTLWANPWLVFFFIEQSSRYLKVFLPYPTSSFSLFPPPRMQCSFQTSSEFLFFPVCFKLLTSQTFSILRAFFLFVRSLLHLGCNISFGCRILLLFYWFFLFPS